MVITTYSTFIYTDALLAEEIRKFLLFGEIPEEQAINRRMAIATLYETHLERVTRYIAVRIGSVNEGEDLASEVFIRALKSVSSFKETGVPLEAWIFRIAHNIVVDHLRAKTRRPTPVSLDDAFSLSSPDDTTEGPELQEQVQALHQAIKLLTEDQRQVLALRFAGEMTAEQVADIMGKRAGALREMQSAAVKKLATLWARSS